MQKINWHSNTNADDVTDNCQHSALICKVLKESIYLTKLHIVSLFTKFTALLDDIYTYCATLQSFCLQVVN